jgi:hypothetical protein
VDALCNGEFDENGEAECGDRAYWNIMSDLDRAFFFQKDIDLRFLISKRLFMSSSELILEDVGPLLNKEELKKVEEQYRLRLPKDYKEFLLKNNGGKPDRLYFRLDGKKAFTEAIHYFLSISDDPDLSFSKYYERYHEADRLRKDLIPIAFDAGGNLVALCLKGSDRGRVYFWDHEAETDGRGARGENLRLIADTFEEFLEGLSETD